MLGKRNTSSEQPKQETYHACDDASRVRSLEEAEMEIFQRYPRLIISHDTRMAIKQRSDQFEHEKQNW